MAASQLVAFRHITRSPNSVAAMRGWVAKAPGEDKRGGADQVFPPSVDRAARIAEPSGPKASHTAATCRSLSAAMPACTPFASPSGCGVDQVPPLSAERR